MHRKAAPTVVPVLTSRGGRLAGGTRALYPSAKGRVEYQLSTKESVRRRVRGTRVPPDTPPAFARVWGVGYEYYGSLPAITGIYSHVHNGCHIPHFSARFFSALRLFCFHAYGTQV